MKRFCIAVFFLLPLSACTEIPKEVPQLSMIVGEDIAAMQASHRQVIRELFRQLKNQRLAYIKHEWTPLFIRKFARKGRIREIASGQIIYDDLLEKFTTPEPAFAEQQLLSSVTGWAQAAIKRIEQKKQALIAPLNREEAEILASIDEGYSRMLAANSQITGFLTSLRDVEAMQDEFLGKLGLGDFRKKINDKLINVSNLAEQGLETIRRIDAKTQ